MKIIGEFEIHDAFKISNHGVVLVGKVLSKGKSIYLDKGDKISFEFENSRITRLIKGYEMGFGRNWTKEILHLQNLGILIQCENKNEIEKLSVWEPKQIKANLIAQH